MMMIIGLLPFVEYKEAKKRISSGIDLYCLEDNVDISEVQSEGLQVCISIETKHAFENETSSGSACFRESGGNDCRSLDELGQTEADSTSQTLEWNR